MDLNKLMMEYLAEEGFRPHETPFGIAFKKEGINFLYFKDEDDEQYFRLMMPAIFVVTEDNEDIIMRAMNDPLRSWPTPHPSWAISFPAPFLYCREHASPSSPSSKKWPIINSDKRNHLMNFNRFGHFSTKSPVSCSISCFFP